MSRWGSAEGPHVEVRSPTGLSLEACTDDSAPWSILRGSLRSHLRMRSVLVASSMIAGLGLLAAPMGIAQTPPQASGVHAPKSFGIGRQARPEEIAGWDIDVRPDGHGLPVGKGTVKEGEALYVERCAACHGEFGESAGRWPILSGGVGTLASHDPVKSIGSYWPYAATIMDYIRRSMPYGNAQSLTNDELSAVTAYVLYLNDAVKDEDFELSEKTFASIKLPNEAGFVDDDRETVERAFWKGEPCMTNCAPGEAKIVGRARAIDVTPEQGKGPKVE
jgi:S-disulfanyl-L-cysteine oxidoreductase SoxD